ncbi:MAG: N-acetyl-gamma-glutamyl-phosphate reductase, partial [bacterium]
MSRLQAGVVGASGVAGAELVECLSGHPEFELDVLTSRKHEGESFTNLYPRFDGTISREFERPETGRLNDLDVVFLAVPHGASMEIVPRLDPSCVKIVDLASDYRFSDVETYERVYNEEHGDPEHITSAIYGLTEINYNQIRNANFVANPGCYATGILLGLYPLVRDDLVDSRVFVDAKSGIS